MRIFPVPKIAGIAASSAARPKARNAPEDDMTRNPPNMNSAAVTIRARVDAGCIAFMRADWPGRPVESMAGRGFTLATGRGWSRDESG